MPEDTGKQRLFFALWPPPGLQRALAERAREALDGRRARRVPAENLHVTLAFLGEVDARTRECAEEAAGSLELPSFTLAIDRLGLWARRGLLWAGPSRAPEALPALAAELGRSLEPCGLERDRRPFRAHLTLARKAAGQPPRQAMDPLEWRVDRFVLVASQLGPGGSAYTLLREWPLHG
ncbi:RNA 2',3'-cyclic phosphodiesterase [Thiohalorhabdus methylotrophus]|uniref:RNA 2',3'-cyclic phosphodiesterase n=1 Tax=Thiohalorhabdus methylotrophus TaxID=3242694 RepID=A0ABV4TZA5_9GAMM